MNTKQRILWIDCFRGYLIIMVVVGHIVQHNIGVMDLSIFNFIYAFHMPLFFAVSGMTAWLAVDKLKELTLESTIKSIWKKFMAVELPNLFWGLLMPLVLCRSWDFSSLTFCVNPYWFLHALFSIFCFHFIAAFLLYQTKSRILKITAVSLFVLTIIMGIVLGHMRFTCLYLSFFYLGFFAHILDTKFNIVRNIALSGLPFALFVFLGTKFDFGEIPSGNPERWPLEMLTSMFAFYALFYYFKGLSNSGNVLYNFVVKCGMYSLPIYILHGFFIPSFSNILPSFPIAVQVIFAVVYALLISWICIGIKAFVKSYKYVNKCLWGG